MSIYDNGQYAEGIDASRWSGEINYDLVPRKYKFFAIRASVGDYYSDHLFQTNFDNGRKDGRVMGAYCVLRPEGNDFGEAQVAGHVRKFEDTVGQRDLDFVVEDVEKDHKPGQQPVSVQVLRDRTFWLADELRRWSEFLFMYTADWFWSAPIHDSVLPKDPPAIPGPDSDNPLLRANGYWLWNAWYHFNNGVLPPNLDAEIVPKGWREGDDSSGGTEVGSRTLQYTDRGRVPGIVSASDLNIMELNTFLTIEAGSSQPPPTPPPPPGGDKPFVTLAYNPDRVDVELLEMPLIG